jgi:hypothetical protein
MRARHLQEQGLQHLCAPEGSIEMIIEPSGDLRFAAVNIRQMYLAFIESGFTDEQAMRLVVHLLPGVGETK